MNKCIIFLRVSTERQEFDSQRVELVKLANNLGYSNDNLLFIGQKESGISLSAEERLSIQELEQTVQNTPEVNCLICWELSRIGRRADTIFYVRDFLLSHSVRWIVNNPYMELIDKSGKITPTANLMLGIFTAFAENEMTLKKERFARGKAHSKELGKYVGGKITFGYAVDPETKKWYPHPENAAVISRIFEMYGTGNHSLSSIAKELHNEGLFQNYTLVSLMNVLARWLKAELYYDCKQYPAIISKEMFDKAAEVRRAHQTEYRLRNVSGFLCKRLLYNKATGYCLACKAKTGLAQGTNDRSIYVSDHRRGNGVNILQHAIDPVVWECAKMLYTKYVMDINKYRDMLTDKSADINHKYKASLDKKQRIQEQIDKVEERLIYGKISEQRANAIVDDLKKELNEEQLKCTNYLTQQAAVLKQISETLTQKEINLEDISFEQKYEIVHQVIEKIWLSKPNPQLRMTVAEIVSAVNDKVYVYQIKTKVVSWKLVHITRKVH